MTSAPLCLFEAAVRLRARHVGDAGYGIAYGSHADGRRTPSSDLDLLLVSEQPLPPTPLDALIEDVVRLHRQHGLDLDEEVAYSSKLHATTAQVEQAVMLDGFSWERDVDLVKVDTVVAEPWFLDSHAFKLRLILNALTVPHVFLGGDVALYRDHVQQAQRALTLLALTLLEDPAAFTPAEVQQALIRDQNSGAQGEDFLGYDEGPHRTPALFSLVQRGLSTLCKESVLVSHPDGQRLTIDSARLREMLRQLHSGQEDGG
jgi:predicted nucleotidyltransferase